MKPTHHPKGYAMKTLLRSSTFYLALAVILLSAVIAFTPSAALDNLGAGLLQVVPASIIGVLLLFGYVALWRRLRLMSDDSDPESEADTAYGRVIGDPLATAVLIGSFVLGIASIIGATLS